MNLIPVINITQLDPDLFRECWVNRFENNEEYGKEVQAAAQHYYELVRSDPVLRLFVIDQIVQFLQSDPPAHANMDEQEYVRIKLIRQGEQDMLTNLFLPMLEE